MTRSSLPRRSPPTDVTLLELVVKLGRFGESPAQVEIRVREMLESGEVRLRGNFRGAHAALLGDRSGGDRKR